MNFLKAKRSAFVAAEIPLAGTERIVEPAAKPEDEVIIQHFEVGDPSWVSVFGNPAFSAMTDEEVRTQYNEAESV